MYDVEPIRSEEEYNEVLRRLIKGAEYIESEEFQHLPAEKQQKAKHLYNLLSYRVMKYKGWV